MARNAAGRPTGLVEETAQAMVQDQFRPYPIGRIVAALDRATARYAAESITTFAEARVGGGWIGHIGVSATYRGGRPTHRAGM